MLVGYRLVTRVVLRVTCTHVHQISAMLDRWQPEALSRAPLQPTEGSSSYLCSAKAAHAVPGCQTICWWGLLPLKPTQYASRPKHRAYITSHRIKRTKKHVSVSKRGFGPVTCSSLNSPHRSWDEGCLSSSRGCHGARSLRVTMRAPPDVGQRIE